MHISKRILLVLFVIVLLWPSAQSVYAAKPRVWTQPAARSSGVSYSRVKLSRPSNSIIITFINLATVDHAEYTLSYTAHGIDQGVVGSITPTGATETRDLYFGTCSKGVCTPHRNIVNARLVITTTLKNGGTLTKRYRIKI